MTVSWVGSVQCSFTVSGAETVGLEVGIWLGLGENIARFVLFLMECYERASHSNVALLQTRAILLDHFVNGSANGKRLDELDVLFVQAIMTGAARNVDGQFSSASVCSGTSGHKSCCPQN